MHVPTKFCCPNCSSEFFGTFTFHEAMGRRPESRWHGKSYVQGQRIGTCNAKHYDAASTWEYEWVRTEENDAKVFVPVSVESAGLIPRVPGAVRN